MGVTPNRYYHDPGIAQVAANLAGLFDAPSGSDLSGYANARQTNEESNRLAQLFAMAQSPDFNQQEFDRMAIANKNYAPVSSYYAVDADTASKRYAVDKTAETSLANNTADNARAMATNKADNTRSLIATLYGTKLAPGEVMPPVSSDILSMYDIPDEGAPGLEQRAGLPKPQSETEVKGGALADLIKRVQEGQGQATADELIKQSVLGAGVEQTVGPDNKPVFTSTFNAAGKTPVDTTPSDPKEYVVTDPVSGESHNVVGFIGPDNKVHDVNNPAQVIPNITGMISGKDVITMTTDKDGNVTTTIGPAGTGKTGKPSEKQLAAQFSVDLAEPVVKELAAAYDDPAKLPDFKDSSAFIMENAASQSDNPFYQALGLATPYLMSDQAQAFYTRLRQVIPEELFVRSGQSVPEQEYRRKLQSFVPKPGEAPESIAVKKQQMLGFIAAAKRMAKGEIGPLEIDAPAPTATTAPAAAAAPGTATETQQPAPASTAAPAAQAAPAATAAPAQPAPAAEPAPAAAAAPAETMSAEDRAASIANAKAAIKSGTYTKEEVAKMLTDGGIVLKPGELD